MDFVNFTAIDFETANNKRSSACSIGMAKVRQGQIVDTYYQLLRPEPLDFNHINTSIHGIAASDVATSETFLEAWPKIRAFIDGDVLVGHNVSFEQSVINQTFQNGGLSVPELDYLCTLYMSRVAYPRRGSYRLPDVYRDLFDAPINHHNALEDAVGCAELGIHLITRFPKQPLANLMGALYITPVREKKGWEKLTGIKPDKDELDCNHPFFGKKIVLTGEMKTMSRERAVRCLVNCGGEYSESVSQKTDFVVFGDLEFQIKKYGQKSTKHQKAEELKERGHGILVVSELEFREFVGSVFEEELV